MMKNIILVAVLITAIILPVQGTIINLPYTEGINIYNCTVDDTIYINIPSGNIIDSIIYKPVFLAGNPGTYDITNNYHCGDIYYTDKFESVISTSLFHIFTNKYEYKVTHNSDSELCYSKEYETYISKYCWYPLKTTSYFGSQANYDEEKVVVESEIFGHTGIKRASDVLDIYGAKAFSSANYTVSHTGFTDLKIIVSYKIEGLHTPDYYIGQLSPTMKNLYNLGFSWLDKELYILNLFIITDKLVSIMMFWFGVLAKSFIPIIIITTVFIVPLSAYMNSNGRKGFISKMVVYYGLYFNIILGFIRYMIMVIMRVLEIVRTLIPFV